MGGDLPPPMMLIKPAATKLSTYLGSRSGCCSRVAASSSYSLPSRLRNVICTNRIHYSWYLNCILCMWPSGLPGEANRRDQNHVRRSTHDGSKSTNEDIISSADTSRRGVLLGELMATLVAGLPSAAQALH